MENRKILTFDELIKLDRRPTLQEMVDVSDETYCKYLFHKGIIPHIPKNYDLINEFAHIPTNDYVLQADIVNQLRQSWYGEDEPDNDTTEFDAGFNLTESQEWNNPNIVEKGILLVNGLELEYTVDIDNYLTVYEKFTDGRYNPNVDIAYYLLDKKQDI